MWEGKPSNCIQSEWRWQRQRGEAVVKSCKSNLNLKVSEMSMDLIWLWCPFLCEKVKWWGKRISIEYSRKKWDFCVLSLIRKLFHFAIIIRAHSSSSFCVWKKIFRNFHFRNAKKVNFLSIIVETLQVDKNIHIRAAHSMCIFFNLEWKKYMSSYLSRVFPI